MRGLLFIVFATIPLIGFCQETFHLKSNIGDRAIWLNGKDYLVDSAGIHLETNYPDFDSIVFYRENRDTMMPILCNFKPDSSYALIGACCGSIDIATSTRLEQATKTLKANRAHLDTSDFDAEVYMAQQFLWDKPSFSFRLTETLEDTIWGWSVDLSCFSLVHPMSTEPLYYGSPEKCFYWSNINHLYFFTHENLGSHEGADGVTYYNWPEQEFANKVASQSVRFFDDHHFLVTVNPKTGKMYIRYDD